MKTLAIDIETYSSTDLTKSGVYKYVEAPDFTVLLFAYSFDGGAVNVVDLESGEEIPQDVIYALQNIMIRKTAYNANFERTCLSKYLLMTLPPNQWECTMMKASMLGLPLSLDQAAKALKLKQEKMTEGKALIRYFSVPCKATKANGGRTRNLPTHDAEKWNTFKEYCGNDVTVELAIRNKIEFFNIPDSERKLWNLDQRINDAGVLLDPKFVRNAIDLDITYSEKLNAEAVELTGLANPNSAAQLKRWISNETGIDVKKLNKDTVPQLLAETECDNVKRLLELRQEMSKTSVTKYEAMSKGICRDSRVRGLLQFYGANRTGRWAGRLVQVQNLPQNHLKDLDLARSIVSDGDLDLLETMYAKVPDILSQLIRTAFVAPVGNRFIVADFSAIEARVIAWLAGEQWRLDVFNTHGKIYEASAAQMFKVPIESIVKGSPLRQKGKVAELALGYQGAVNALITMGALKMGLFEEELPKLVSMWRNANKAIVKLWRTVEDAATQAIVNRTPVQIMHGIRFFVERGLLFIQLPSGRRLSYLRPAIRPNKYGNDAITYEGMNQMSKQWESQETYGGKLVENIIQAIARDCLADAMLRIDQASYKIVMHVHDEVVLEVPNGKGSLQEINDIMGTSIAWAKGLPLRADSYETNYYKKD